MSRRFPTINMSVLDIMMERMRERAWPEGVTDVVVDNQVLFSSSFLVVVVVSRRFQRRLVCLSIH